MKIKYTEVARNLYFYKFKLYMKQLYSACKYEFLGISLYL